MGEGDQFDEVASARTEWLAELDRALNDAEGLTARLASCEPGGVEAAMLLSQIRFARATLDELRAGISIDHPDWVDLFRSLAELGGSFA
jgi:hypothetical protein